MKRMMGKFLVAALLSGGVILGAASPSTALPRDACMDADNYSLQVQWYEGQAMLYLDTWSAWANADHYWNPLTGQETWAADTSAGTYYVFNITDYNNRVNTANYNYNYAVGQMNEFVNTTEVCP